MAHGGTLVTNAVGSNCVKLAEYLIRLGIKDGWHRNAVESPLHVAGRTGNSAMVKTLLNYSSGDPALHIAAECGNAAVMHVLLAAGASINSRNRQQKTALHVAAGRKQLQARAVLLQAGGQCP